MIESHTALALYIDQVNSKSIILKTSFLSEPVDLEETIIFEVTFR